MTLGCDYDDVERLCLSAVWADDAMRWLENELEHGGLRGTKGDTHMRLETLCDGLRVLSDTLHAMTVPFPPPSVPPPRDGHLRVVK
jgi:hypothetical protein